MGDMDGAPPLSIGLAAINSTLNSKKAQYLDSVESLHLDHFCSEQIDFHRELW
jgi:hypothetical protein